MTIPLATLVMFLVWLAIGGLIFWILWWGLHKIAPPEPALKVGEVILILAICLWLINLLLTLAGHPFIRFV